MFARIFYFQILIKCPEITNVKSQLWDGYLILIVIIIIISSLFHFSLNFQTKPKGLCKKLEITQFFFFCNNWLQIFYCLKCTCYYDIEILTLRPIYFCLPVNWDDFTAESLNHRNSFLFNFAIINSQYNRFMLSSLKHTIWVNNNSYLKKIKKVQSESHTFCKRKENLHLSQTDNIWKKGNVFSVNINQQRHAWMSLWN